MRPLLRTSIPFSKFSLSSFLSPRFSPYFRIPVTGSGILDPLAWPRQRQGIDAHLSLHFPFLRAFFLTWPHADKLSRRAVARPASLALLSLSFRDSHLFTLIAAPKTTMT